MGKGDALGELELYVMLAVAHAGAEAYGVTIRQEIASRTGRDVAIGAVYATLARLEGKGWSHMSCPIAEGAVQRRVLLRHA